MLATPQKGASGPVGDVGAPGAPGHVLGAETESPVAPLLDFVTQVATSPNHVITYVLGGLAGLFLVLLLIAVFVHARVQYLEVIGGGLLIILVALSLLAFDALQGSVRVPSPGPGAASART